MEWSGSCTRSEPQASSLKPQHQAASSPKPRAPSQSAPSAQMRASGLWLAACGLRDALRAHDGIGVVQCQRDDAVAVAFKADDRRWAADRVKCELALVNDPAL